EARHEDELDGLIVGQHIVRPDEAARASLGEDALRIHAAPIVAHFNTDVAAAMAHIETQMTDGGFAAPDAHVRLLDAVVDAVADEVHERIADLLEHRLVELGLLARHDELDLLAETLREIAHHAREAAENEADGQHAHAHDAVLQLAHVA